jgi:hypothetical protein
MAEIEVTDDMVAAGDDVLASQGEYVDAAEPVRAIYVAMAEKAPPPPNTRQAEAAPAKVVQIARRKD